MNKTGFIAACVMASIGFGAASGAQAFKVPEAQGNQHNHRLLQRISSPSPVTEIFLHGKAFFVTVESDFSSEQNGIDKIKAEEEIGDKVADFLKPIIEHYSKKPAIFLRPAPQKPNDFPESKDFVNIRVYLHSNLNLSTKTHYNTSLNFKIFWMGAMGKLDINGPNTEIYQYEAYMIIPDDLPQPPYQYQCRSMYDCYNDLLTKNLDDALRHYFSGYYENSLKNKKSGE